MAEDRLKAVLQTRAEHRILWLEEAEVSGSRAGQGAGRKKAKPAAKERLVKYLSGIPVERCGGATRARKAETDPCSGLRMSMGVEVGPLSLLVMRRARRSGLNSADRPGDVLWRTARPIDQWIAKEPACQPPDYSPESGPISRKIRQENRKVVGGEHRAGRCRTSVPSSRLRHRSFLVPNQ